MATIKYTAQWIGGPHDGTNQPVQRTDTHHATKITRNNNKNHTTIIETPITHNQQQQRTLIWTPQHTAHT